MKASQVSIGREEGCDLTIPDSRISKRHCRIFQVQSSHFIEDLDSTHGTFVNGHRVKRARLKPNDRIRLGTSILCFKK